MNVFILSQVWYRSSNEVAFLTKMNIFSRGWAMLVSVQVVGS